MHQQNREKTLISQQDQFKESIIATIIIVDAWNITNGKTARQDVRINISTHYLYPNLGFSIYIKN